MQGELSAFCNAGHEDFSKAGCDGRGGGRYGLTPPAELFDRVFSAPAVYRRSPYYPAGDSLHEECGVFGIFGDDDAAVLTALGLHALQHRGQEGAGIVSFDGRQFHLEKRQGLVGDNFSQREVVGRLKGSSAVGHVRYSTAGGSILRNVQPLFAELGSGGFAVGHNGNLTNGLYLRQKLIGDGALYHSTSDTEAVLHLVAQSRKPQIIDRFIEALRQLEGAFSFVALTNGKLIGARDAFGIRPLVLGERNGCFILASETCALDMIEARYVRDVENGEVVVISDEGLRSFRFAERRPLRPCIFEYIYFSRPDSVVNGISVYDARLKFGQQLAAEAPADVDMVVPIPDSGVAAALGYARALNLPYELGIIRNHYIGRTFIEPTQAIRQLGVRLKHAANRAAIAGKRLVLIDDSLVRGTTSVKIVHMLREAGAREIHFRIACPPITHPDYYGIDTPKRENLLASSHTVEEMRAIVGADSLAFLSVDGLYRAMGFAGGRDPIEPQFTDHCFTGDYPTRLLDIELEGALNHETVLKEAV
ncbi:MAG: amidophosphoribosyltransferase [Methylobacteriaceae bacterium]|jgi:amidophosphoribosyltransferase|nr:amidophosphoribosyltransferase [Methylobacteriaceae bacterium]